MLVTGGTSRVYSNLNAARSSLKALTLRFAPLALIATLSLVAMTRHIRDPWVYSNDSNGPMNSIFAKNYLKFGYLESKFGQRMSPRIWGEDPASPGLLRYYVDHPPLVPILVSLSFLMVGVGEASARLVPVIFSVLSIVFVYLLAEKAYRSKTYPIWTICLYAFTPMFVFFGQMPNHEAVTQAFVLATLYFYFVWLESERVRDFLLSAVTLALGMMSGWPAYYLGALLPIHYWLFRGHHNRKRVLTYPLMCFGMFGLFLAHVYWLEGARGTASLFAKFLLRSGGGFTAGQFLLTQARYLDYGYTPVLILLMGIFLVRLVIEIAKGPIEPLRSEGAFVILVLIGLMHVVLFKQGAFAHPYWTYYLSAPFALAGAGVIDRIFLRRDMKLKWRGLRISLVASLVVAFFLMSVPRIQFYYTQNRSEALRIGKLINKVTQPGDLVLTSLGYMGTQLPYYADRDIHYGVTTTGRLVSLVEHATTRCQVFVAKQKSIDPEGLVAFLKQHFKTIVMGGFYVFPLSGCNGS